jgi:hypothetical protein
MPLDVALREARTLVERAARRVALILHASVR